MKIPRWKSGQGRPDPEENGSESEERTRLERARRERLRAQRRLAAMAGGEKAEDSKVKDEPEKAERRKDEPEKAERKSVEAKRESEEPKRDPKPESKTKSRRKTEPEPEVKPQRKARPKRGEKPRRGAKDTQPPKLEPARARRSGTAKRRDSPKAKSTGSRRGRALKAGGIGNALKQGAKATRANTKGVPSKVGRTILGALGVVFGIFFDLLGFVLNVLIAIGLFVAGPIKAVGHAAARLVRTASALATPIRVLSLVVAGAAVLLALSQFADYKSVSVGSDAYIEVETVAPAPEKERAETGSAHSYAMVPVAIISLALLGAAVAGRRWQLCRLIAAAGVIAIAVSLLIDRPAGLDPGDLELAFEGVSAKLLGGFYAQLFAGLLLSVSSLMLGRELRLAGAKETVREGRRKSKWRMPRRSPKAEGARA